MDGSTWTLTLVLTMALAMIAVADGEMTSGLAFVRSPQPIVAPPGDRVVFECETNVPPERIIWLHNRVELTSNSTTSSSSSSSSRSGGGGGGVGNNKRKGREIASDSTAASYRMREEQGSPKNAVHLILRISKNPHRYRQQAGDYQCVAWFGAVALTSLPARLSIAVLGDFPYINLPTINSTTVELTNFQQQQQQQQSGPGRPTLRDSGSSSRTTYVFEVFSGETAILPCPAPPSDPPATLTFFKDNKPISESDRVKLMASGNLHIIDVTQTDQGHYTCTAANHITGELIDGQRILKLVVTGAPSRAKPLAMTWEPEERYIAQIGQNVTLECAASGWPKPQIRWSREGNRPLPHNRSYYLGGGALVVTTLADQDEGGYICEASNGALSPTIRASTLLQLTEPVSMVKAPKDARVEEGARISLDCQAKGRPPPQVYWVFNGISVDNDPLITVTDQQLIITNVTKRHAGIFQCFVSNALTKVAGGAATVQVVPPRSSPPPPLPLSPPVNFPSSSKKSVQEIEDEEDEEDFEIEDFLEPIATTATAPKSATSADSSKAKQGGGGGGGSAGAKGKKNSKNRPREMIPPSRPNIIRLTDESVMVRWTVPPNKGLPIEFFKVQFKEADKKGSRWKTIDEDVPTHIRSYEVTGLKSSQTYRFRIAAVYSNNDNKLGDTSARFILEKEQPKKKPTFTPVIEVAEAVSQSAVMIQWKYPDLDSVPPEGFFIYYRSTTSAGDYNKVTVLGSNTRSHIVTHLLPETHYDLKMQAFNMQGTSDFSRILTVRTQGSIAYNPPTNRLHNGNSKEVGDLNNSLEPLDVVSSDTAVSNDMLYVVVGSVLGGFTVLVVLLVALYQCRQRTSTDADRNPASWSDANHVVVNGKPMINSDNGNTIHHQVSPNNLHHHHYLNHQHKIHGNGYITETHLPYYVDRNQKDHNDTAETSFCDRTHRSSGDLIGRSTDSLSRNSLRRTSGYARSNGSTPSLMLNQQHLVNNRNSRAMAGNNDMVHTLPLLRQQHRGRMRDPCLDDAEWEASVPPADSEKFI